MADDTKRMNVLYSSDDNYAQHMGVSIYSLLRHLFVGSVRCV